MALTSPCTEQPADTIYHSAERLTFRSRYASACAFTTPQSQLNFGVHLSAYLLIVKELAASGDLVCCRVDGNNCTGKTVFSKQFKLYILQVFEYVIEFTCIKVFLGTKKPAHGGLV
ncbi:hypothetical protein MIFENG_31 [Hafnia phage vB_HpaM_Meifeng]|nr:hypothetical protein MIFENG_31 [Hafnia phage vB_HpaM_Meifeng]